MRRSCRCGQPAAVILIIVCASTASIIAADSPVGRSINDKALERLLVDEIAAALDGSQRLVSLPRNIIGLTIGPGGEPCFSLGGNSTEPAPLQTVAARAVRHAPGFRLLWGGRMLGCDGDTSMAVTSGPETAVALIDGDESRIIALPDDFLPQQACRAGGRWVFVTRAGVKLDNDASPWPGTQGLQFAAWHRLVRVGTDGLAVLALDRDANAKKTIRHCLWQKGTLTTGTVTLPGDIARTVMRRSDGVWLAIGEHIVEVGTDRPSRPIDTQQLAVLASARAGEWAALPSLIETLSAYPPRDTQGLANLLKDVPPTELRLRAVSDALDNARRELTRGPATAGLDRRQAESVGEVLAACEKQLLQTAQKLDEVVPELRLGTAAEIASRLNAGMQFYRGRWISVLDVVRQDDIDSVLLWVGLTDHGGKSIRSTALARLEPDGGLRLVAHVPDDLMPGAHAASFATTADAMYAVVPGRGVVRIAESGVEWLATTGRLTGPVRVIGADARGRVYFRESRPQTTSVPPGLADVFWVLTPQAPANDDAPLTHWATVGQPSRGVDGGIWFLRPQPDQVPQPAAEDAASVAGIEVKRIIVKAEAGTSQPGSRPAFPTLRSAPHPCRLTGPRSLTEYVLPDPLAATSLVAGRDAFWLVGPDRGENAAIAFVAGDELRIDKDLHALAARAFDALLAAAPEAQPVDWRSHSPATDDRATPQLLQTGDKLWVNDAGRLEIYSRGRPLGVADRLALAGFDVKNSRLIGPLKQADGAVVALLADRLMADRSVWIRLAENGLILEPLVSGEAGPGRFGVTWRPDGPLVAADRAGLFARSDSDTVWRLRGPEGRDAFAGAGTPILALPGGDAFLAFGGRFIWGLTLFRGAARVEVPVLATRRLHPVGVTTQGHVLCFEPDGLAWLAPHPDLGYVPAGSRRLHNGLTPTSYVGPLPGAEVVTAEKWAPHQMLVVVPDPTVDLADQTKK